MLKRILSIILCLSIFVCSVFMCIPFSVKADSIYNTIYDGYDYSSVISQHKTFSFTDKGGKKHTVFKATSSSAWICVFGGRQVISDDDELNYYLSWYSYTGYQSKLNAFSQFLVAQMGAITKGASTILEDTINNSSSIDVDYNDNDGLTISSDSVDKLRAQLKKQYYASIGLHEVKPVNSVKSVLSSSKFRNFYEHEEDFVSDSLAFKDYNYMFISDYNCIFFNNYDYAYLNREEWVYSARGQVNYYPIYFMNGKSDADRFPLEYRSVLHYSVLNNSNAYNFYSNMKNIFANDRYSFFNFYYLAYKNSSEVNYQTDRIGLDGFVDFYGTKPFKYFVSYSSYYNYLYGDQNAYLSSKVEEAGEDIKISIDDMNTNISDKMDSLIDSINNKKEGMSADELQKAIDKGLASLSGKMDDIKDNTQETNNKLDGLLTVMQSQNEILMNILGVTTDIYKVVSSTNKEDGTNYTISDLQPHFNKCFTAIKNMVLYGVSSFDDVGAQSVMSVDNDVGEIMLADDVENHVKDYHNGLLGKFPFSVPYQLYEWLQVLQAEPKTPEFTYDYGFMLKYFGMSYTDTTIKFDLSQYDEWAKNARSFLKLSFTLALAVGTYRKFKGEI